MGDTEDTVEYAYVDRAKARLKLTELQEAQKDVYQQYEKCLNCIYHDTPTKPDENEISQYCTFGDIVALSLEHYFCKNYMSMREDVIVYYLEVIEISE